MSRRKHDKSTAPAEADPTAADMSRQHGQEQPAEEEDWGDNAARARTADDPRAVAPHDRTGVPSTGDRR